MTRRCVQMLVLSLLASLAAAAPAGAAWQRVSPQNLSNIDEPSALLLGDTVLMGWYTPGTAPFSSGIDTATFSSTRANPAQGVTIRRVTDNWSNINHDPLLLATPGGGAAMAFAGIHSTTTGDPLTGISISPRLGDGSWGPPGHISSRDLNYGLAGIVLPDGVSLLAGSRDASGVPVYRGVTDTPVEAKDGPGSYVNLSMARDGAGTVWIAWYAVADASVAGIYLRQLNPLTGEGVGPAVRAPGSESIYNQGSRINLACRSDAAGCRVVYQDSAIAATRKIYSWGPGETAPTVIGTSTGNSDFAAAYRPDGRLWVAWWSGSTKNIDYLLGNTKGAGGTVLHAGQPAGTAALTKVSAMPIGDDVLLYVNAATPLSANTWKEAIWVNRVGLPTATPDTTGPRDVDVGVVPGSKGKAFRIQVQYRVKTSCSNPCRARGELRTRVGRRVYATAPLKGDGKLVLGTRLGLKLPTTKKVRFYLTISKAALLKTPFHTEGGSRVAETRLRVWLKTPSGEVLTVRDGRIKVSIARIKSGALPGLTGIL